MRALALQGMLIRSTPLDSPPFSSSSSMIGMLPHFAARISRVLRLWSTALRFAPESMRTRTSSTHFRRTWGGRGVLHGQEWTKTQGKEYSNSPAKVRGVVPKRVVAFKSAPAAISILAAST